MTRFNITLNQGIDVVLHAINNLFGGEIIIPKLKSFKILDLAKTMNRNNKYDFWPLLQEQIPFYF